MIRLYLKFPQKILYVSFSKKVYAFTIWSNGRVFKLAQFPVDPIVHQVVSSLILSLR